MTNYIPRTNKKVRANQIQAYEKSQEEARKHKRSHLN